MGSIPSRSNRSRFLRGKTSAFIIGNNNLNVTIAKDIIAAAQNVPVLSYSKLPVEDGALGGFVADDIKLGRMLAESIYDVVVKGKPVKDRNASYANLPEVEDRLIMRMLNEAVACLRENVVDSEQLIDAGVIFGTGFAPFRGGPLHHIRAEGVDTLRKRMEELKSRYGERFGPDAGWNNM